MLAKKVVALAASSGGLSAVREVLQGLPQELPAAILVLIHLSPHHRSRLAEVLAWQTHYPVDWASNDQALESGHVYVAPPSVHTLIDEERRLRLVSTPKRHFTRPSAEPLFESVAREFGPDSILVTLTGGGRNGSESLRYAKERGARILVQDPATAQVPSMPSAAIATGACDAVLDLAGIVHEIERWACGGVQTLVNGPG